MYNIPTFPQHNIQHEITSLLAIFQVLNEEPYSLKCDVFSFGMLLYELIFCKEPFSDIPAMEAAAKIRNGEVSILEVETE